MPAAEEWGGDMPVHFENGVLIENRVILTEDGYRFHEQPDGSWQDTGGDMIFSSLEQLLCEINVNWRFENPAERTGATNALATLLQQLFAIGIFIPGVDQGNWNGTEGLSFAEAHRVLFETRKSP